MPLLMNELAGFLAAGGVTAPFIYDARPWVDVPAPDLMVQLNPKAGPGFSLERELDTMAVQIECRGAQNDPDSAEALAWQIDEVLCAPAPPVEIGPGTTNGLYTTARDIDRAGTPALAAWDPSLRSYFVCVYRFTVVSYGPA